MPYGVRTFLKPRSHGTCDRPGSGKRNLPHSPALSKEKFVSHVEPALANSDHQSEIKDLQSTIHFVPALAIGPSRPFVGLIEQRYSDINRLPRDEKVVAPSDLTASPMMEEFPRKGARAE